MNIVGGMVYALVDGVSKSIPMDGVRVRETIHGTDNKMGCEFGWEITSLIADEGTIMLGGNEVLS